MPAVSPSARSETSTPATSVVSGSSQPACRYARSAVAHRHRTTSLIDASSARPVALTSPSVSEALANARWLVIDTLNGVTGASLKRVPTAATGASAARRPRRSRLAIAARAPASTAPASGGASFTTCWTGLLGAAPSSSATPRW